MKLRSMAYGTLGAFACLSLLALPSCELGNSPVGPSSSPSTNTTQPGATIAVDSVSENLRIWASPSVLNASESHVSLVEVRAYDSLNHNPVAGEVVSFSATHGSIGAADTTDEFGFASVIFVSEPQNTDVRVSAEMVINDEAQSVSTVITLSGLEVQIAPAYRDAYIGSTVPVTVSIIDAAGRPVSSRDVVLVGMADSSGQTNGAGAFASSVTRATEGVSIIEAYALGDTTVDTVSFWVTIPEGSSDTVVGIRSLRIYSSRSQLKANNSDNATITAIVTDEKNNPLEGDVVLFSSDLGVIDKSAVVDSTGRATATLRSSPVNGLCQVVAELEFDSEKKDSISVVFSGITMDLTSEETNLSVGDSTTVQALLKDASGNPIGGDAVVFSITSNDGEFTDGSKTRTGTLDATGLAAVGVTSSNADSVTIQAASLNTTGTLTLYFSASNLSLSASKSVVDVGGDDSCKITATYRDDRNRLTSGVDLIFASNAGTINTDTVTTNSLGKANTWLLSSDFTGTVTVTVRAIDRSAGSASIEVFFSTDQAYQIELAISPDNIGVNGGVASLKATVRDSMGNMVSGTDVNFKILDGPGGGEYIDRPVVAAQNGVARSELLAGSQPSLYRAVEVVAIVGTIADTSKLTISGEPHIVTISRPQDDTVTVPDAGTRDPTTFEFNIGAVVQDVNGNPVADGTKVQFSALVSGLVVRGLLFDGWAGLGSSDEVKPKYKSFWRDIPFEDVNNDTTMDPGIDLDLNLDPTVASRGEDVNGDGAYDFDYTQHDIFFDFNNNGQCDVGYGEWDTTSVGGEFIWADLNNNGMWDTTELVYDANGDGLYDANPSGDFPFATAWETRHYLPSLSFTNNDFAMVIEASVTTTGGVAETNLTYPRQFALRLVASVNAESNGIRDKDGERFILPVIVSK